MGLVRTPFSRQDVFLIAFMTNALGVSLMPANPPLTAETLTTETIRGMVLMAIAMLIIPGIDVFAKLLTPTMSAGQIVWFRFFVQTLLEINKEASS